MKNQSTYWKASSRGGSSIFGTFGLTLKIVERQLLNDSSFALDGWLGSLGSRSDKSISIPRRDRAEALIELRYEDPEEIPK